MGLPTPQSPDSPPASPSQRLPHKVRKLYSALERLLVSAGLRPLPPEILLLGFSAAPLPVLGHLQRLQPWVRAWFSLVCEFGGLAEEGGVSPYGESASCIIRLSMCGGGPGCSSEGACAGQCLALGIPRGHWFPADLPQEPVPTVAPSACQGLSVVPQETQGAKGRAEVRR